MKRATELPSGLEQLVSEVIGAAIEVHRQLGPGFLESIYEQALCIELDERRIRFERQKEIVVPYKGQSLGGQRLDLLVEHRLVLELKAVEQLAPIHQAQLLSYLKALRLPAGLLLNFNVRQMRDGIKRLVLSDHRPPS
jgi:GxxExxY protein